MINITSAEADMLNALSYISNEKCIKMKKDDRFDNAVFDTMSEGIVAGRLSNEICKWVLGLGYVQFLGLYASFFVMWGGSRDTDDKISIAATLFNRIEAEK